MANRIFFILLISLLTAARPQSAYALQEDLGIQVPEGFIVEKVAGPKLANDIYSLAVSDIDGKVFVAGRGYIKRLIDSNRDGMFESSELFSSIPKNGAQGLLALEDQFICTGDQGVLSIQNGVVKVLVPMKTGAEHGTHAVRLGPDKKLYVLAGNATKIESDFFSDPASPIQKPRAGFLMRMNRDGTQKQIVAHGFRNAYDFDFNDAGEIFVYDSDGERDISLPWYRPTRVYQIRAGDDAGWVTAGWKRPSDYLDMPKTIAKLGRGSPTGVCVYRRRTDKHQFSFPPKYHNAVFVGDWTFGRVVALLPNDSGDDYQQIEFAQSTGQSGFAVTDIAMDFDGSLLISVGGRGTRGAVYRIRHLTGENHAQLKTRDADRIANSIRVKGHLQTMNKLVRHLQNPETTVVIAALEQLIRHPELATINESKTSQLVDLLQKKSSIDSPSSEGLVLNVLKSMPTAEPDDFSKTADPVPALLVELAAAKSQAQRAELLLKTCQFISTVESESELRRLIRIAQLSMDGCTDRPTNLMFSGYEPTVPLNLTKKQRDQALTDLHTGSMSATLRPAVDGVDPASGYAVEEIGRLAAMLSHHSETQLGVDGKFDAFVLFVLALQDDEKPKRNPLKSRIHQLNVLAKMRSTCLPFDEDSPQSIRTMAALILSIPNQLEQRNQPIDRNFYPRLNHTVKVLLDNVQGLGFELAKQIQPNGKQLSLFELIVSTQKTSAKTRALLSRKLKKFVEARPDEVTNLHLSLLVKLEKDAATVLRKFAQRPDVRLAVLQGLTRLDPSPVDVRLFVEELASPQPDRLKLAATGLSAVLRKAGESQVASDVLQGAVGIYGADRNQAGLVVARATRALDRMNWSRAEIVAKDSLIRLLRQISGKNFDYQLGLMKPNGNQKKPQTEAIESWIDYAAKKFPDEMARENASSHSFASVRELANRLADVQGDADRGKIVYQKFRCAQCHDSGSRLGPRLEGIGKRFSKVDMIQSILDPNESVPDRYKATVLSLSDGTLVRGTVIYDSVAGIVIQKEDGMTATLSGDQIDDRMISGSLMPEGLMKGASDQDWANLLEFLRSR